MGIYNSSEERDLSWEACRGVRRRAKYGRILHNFIRPRRRPWTLAEGLYVNWAKKFANFLPEKPLRDRPGKDNEAFREKWKMGVKGNG